MDILVVSQYYYPEQFRINDICEDLVKNGHSVNVLTGLPNYPSGVVSNDYKYWKRRNENINGVNIHRSFLIGRGANSVSLFLNYVSFAISASFKIIRLKNKFDLIFVYQLSPVTMALPAVFLKSIKNIPVFLYSCDIWPESVRTIIKNESSLVFKMVKKISHFIYKECDLIAVSSSSFLEYFRNEHNIGPSKLKFIPQHAEDFYLHFNHTIKNGITDFVFMGNIGIAQDIESIIYATNLIKESEKFLVHIVGDGSNLLNLKNLVKKLELEKLILFHGRKSHEEIQYFYELADACLLTLREDNKTGLTLPSKLQSYMAAGKYIIGAINGSSQDVIRSSNCGQFVNSGDYTGLSRLMFDFIDNNEKYRPLGENGRDYFNQHFTKEIYMSSIMNEMETIVRGVKNV